MMLNSQEAAIAYKQRPLETVRFLRASNLVSVIACNLV